MSWNPTPNPSPQARRGAGTASEEGSRSQPQAIAGWGSRVFWVISRI
ncbi:hypothetical protein [Coleofasciculus sp. FACHB-129]|nr:hypothetical protein [Coleofasciculus sp. FACHB-129]MBD1898235.1 hypothetical protein [Coleofasciculus sp. FACHB-129]